MHSIEFLELSGQRLEPYFRSIAELRINVFREYPYLYEGSHEYEEEYLRPLFESSNSIGVIAMAEGKCIGFSSGLPIEEAHQEFKEPFTSFFLPTPLLFYFGESVLLPEFRGRGIGRELMMRRIRFAERLSQYKAIVFCAIDRSMDTSPPPPSYRSPERLWRAAGFKPLSGVSAQFSWKEIGALETSNHPMLFWGRSCSSWNCELVRRYYQWFNEGRWEELLALLDEDVIHNINQGDCEPGIEKFRQFLVRMAVCYEERVHDCEYFTCSESGAVAVRYAVIGTYKKKDGSFPVAKGQSYSLGGGCFFDVFTGKIKKINNYYNLHEWLQQINESTNPQVS